MWGVNSIKPIFSQCWPFKQTAFSNTTEHLQIQMVDFSENP
jgi:hypothetical protein